MLGVGDFLFRCRGKAPILRVPLPPAAAAAATAGEGENAHGQKRQKRRPNAANEGSSHEQFLLGLWNMRSREDSKRALGTLDAFRFHLAQEGVRVTLHLGNAAATADVDGLPLHRHGDSWPHAAQRLARDGAGLLSSVKRLRGERGRRGSIRRLRIATICWRRGREIGGVCGLVRHSGRMDRHHPSTAATTATATATTASAAAVTAATGEQDERHQGSDHEPTAWADEAKRPCHPRTSLSGRYMVAVGLRVALRSYYRQSKYVSFNRLPSHPAKGPYQGCEAGAWRGESIARERGGARALFGGVS